MHWMLMPYRRYAEFSGRSRRMEFWMFTLFSFIVMAVIYALILGGGAGQLLMASVNGTASPTPELVRSALGPMFWIGVAVACIFALGSFIPSLAVTIRRLHDRNLTGWLFLGYILAVVVAQYINIYLYFLVIIGWYVLLALPGRKGPNKYGPDPLDPSQAEVFS